MSIDIQKLRELLAKAPPMPWGGDRFDGTVKYNLLDANKEPVICGDNSNEDGGPYGTLDSSTDDLLIALSNCLPQLIDEIEALRKAWTEAESDNNNLRAEIENTRAEPVRNVIDETVEEMSKLFHEANNYRGSWDGPDCPFKNSIRFGMRAAIKAAGVEVTE